MFASLVRVVPGFRSELWRRNDQTTTTPLTNPWLPCSSYHGYKCTVSARLNDVKDAAIRAQNHDSQVNKIATEVRKFASEGKKFRICHGSSNSTRPATTNALLNVSALHNILAIELSEKGSDGWCLVEPNVPMDKLIVATMRHGLIPPVVMEFPGITVGGGFSGTSAESSSFKYGFFSDNVEEVEMILGDGEILTASHEDHPDLFRAAAGACGTLGIVTKLKLRLVHAKKFVHVRYHRFSDITHMIDEMRKMQEYGFDHLDGILFAKHHCVAITGELVDEKKMPEDCRIKTFSHAADEWYYRYVERKTCNLATSTTIDDYVPLAEYLFRYDRGGFWVGQMGYDYFKNIIPFNGFMRWLLDDFSHTRTLYHALHATNVSRKIVVQDLTVPWSKAANLVDHISSDLDIWPLWLCPLSRAASPSFHPTTDTRLAETQGASGMLSVGVWGWGPLDTEVFIAKNRRLESVLAELGGRKWLYAHTFYTEEEFDTVYGREWYEDLRRKYHATNLPTVFEKVQRSSTDQHASWWHTLREVWPVGGVYGMWKALHSGDIYLHRNAEWKWSHSSL